MTREEFIEILDKEGYSYKIKGDSIIVTHEGDVNLNSLTSLPPGVEFNNRGSVLLYSLKTLPLGVEFNNEEEIFLDSVTSLPPGVEFKNGGDVYLNDLIDGYFDDWPGNIEGIDSKRLLNFMISKGMFI